MGIDVSASEARALLANAGKVAVLTHENPDGDAIGSAFGLALLLRQAGKQVALLLAAEPPETYRPFAAGEFRTEYSQGELADADLVVQLDTATAKRIAAPAGLTVTDALPLLVIDHHPDNSRYGRWNLVVPAAATCGIVAEIADAAPALALTPQIATLLLLGLVTDTGGFRFDNTDSASLRAAARLFDAGAQYRRIIDRIFFNQDLERRKFEAELLNSHLELKKNGRLAVVKIPAEVIAAHHIDMAETEGLIDVFRALSGVELVAMLYKRANNVLKVSLRARNPERPAGPIARKLGGGGHEMAAGALIPGGDMDETAAQIEAMFDMETT